MNEYERLSHTTWDCKYHVVFIPKCRRKTLYQELRRHLGEVFRKLALQKESKVEEGHLMPDHVHMLLSIPPKYAVSQVVGFIKGKSAIHMARVYGERKRNFVGQHFWARGFFVNTVGRDEEAIRAYIRNQEKEDQRLEQMNLWRRKAALGGSKFKGPRQPFLPLRAAPILKPPALPGDTYLFATLISETPAAQGHLNRLVISRAARARLIHDIELQFGDRLQSKTQNYTVSATSVLLGYLQNTGFKCADEPE